MIATAMLIEIAGWLGAAMLLVAFGLVSYGVLGARSRSYQVLNTLSGLLLAVNSSWHQAWPSAAVNIIWIAIAVSALAIGRANVPS
ncbi:MAG: CBU_0592 family membrane protein [Steroidobacteraceae bacterium]